MSFRLSETLYFVRDMDDAIRFYTEQIGFTLEQRYDWGFAVLNADGSCIGLMLESAWDREFPDTDELPKPRIALQTDDFDTQVHRLRTLGVAMGTVNGHHGGRQTVTFCDLDENPIFLWSDPEEPMK